MLSIVYITFRQHCKIEWFIQSLVQQTDTELRKQIQIIVVDGILNEVDDGAYSLTINTNELLLPYISRTDIIDDYFSKVWNVSNCVAGPFTDLSNKCLQLNKAFISNQ